MTYNKTADNREEAEAYFKHVLQKVLDYQETGKNEHGHIDEGYTGEDDIEPEYLL